MSLLIDKIDVSVSRRANVQPEDMLKFVELTGFAEELEQIGLSRGDLTLVRLGLMCHPRDGTPVRGAPSIRDSEVLDRRRAISAYVRYAYLDDAKTILLIKAYRSLEPMTSSEVADAEWLVSQIVQMSEQ